MATQSEKIGSVVQKGILLLSKYLPLPAPAIVAAVSAAAITKILDLREAKITEILSIELNLSHISYVNPDNSELLAFYSRNPIFPELASEFQKEIQSKDFRTLRRFYPLLYGALILKRQVPTLLFHQEIESKQYRNLAMKYEELSKGFSQIDGHADAQNSIDELARDFIEVLSEMFIAAKKELKGKDNQLIFDVIDYVREVAGL